MQRVISFIVTNQPGVLSRVAGLISRRGFNIESLAAGSPERQKITELALNAPVVTVELPLPRKQVAGWNANYEANIIDLWSPPYDLSGEGYTLGMWDGGAPDINHPE